MDSVEEKERINAALRWAFCKTCIEPVIAAASNDDGATALLPNHKSLIANWRKAILIVKCRKTAHSWGISLKALARALTEDRSTTIIGSYDEDEAKEKLEFLQWQYEALSLTEAGRAIQRSIKMSDGMETRRFSNGSRIRFISRKAPTGPGASIEWDEFSVEPPGRVTSGQILAAAIGCTTHTGTISLGGTERGPETLFHQIVSGKHDEMIKNDPILKKLAMPTWRVYRYPWWCSPALCVNVPLAKEMAPHMPTGDRVVMFGNASLQYQFATYCTTPDLGLPIFQREFEMMVLDDRESYYSFDLITSCYPFSYEDYWFRPAEIEGVAYGRLGDALKKAKRAIDLLAMQIASGGLRGSWGWAMDIGRDRDRDEIWIGEAPNNAPEKLNPRVNIGASLLPFDGKKEIIEYLFKRIPITRGYVDGTRGSVGRQLSEWAHKRWGQRAAPFIFDNTNKQIIASGLKARMESANIRLPAKTPKYDRLENQMLQVKKQISKSGNVIFDVERNKGFHGDCFWALAMLAELFSQPVARTPQRPAVAQRDRPGVGLPVPAQLATRAALPKNHTVSRVNVSQRKPNPFNRL